MYIIQTTVAAASCNAAAAVSAPYTISKKNEMWLRGHGCVAFSGPGRNNIFSMSRRFSYYYPSIGHGPFLAPVESARLWCCFMMFLMLLHKTDSRLMLPYFLLGLLLLLRVNGSKAHIAY
jgi:thiosulfate reductase cytochrome b subunit